MSRLISWLAAGTLLVAPVAFASSDYVGVLKPSSRLIAIPDSALGWPYAGSFGNGVGAGTGAEGGQLRLGYRYSRNWSVEAGYSDSGWGGTRSPFAGPRAGQRYGLGLKYDLTRSFGLKADMEHYSPFSRWSPRQPESDQVTLGVFWRF
jgi:hypothetical protein